MFVKAFKSVGLPGGYCSLSFTPPLIDLPLYLVGILTTANKSASARILL
jgi:hypothetical protein